MIKILIFSLFLSCVRTIPIRSDYKLQSVDDFLVTNIYTNPEMSGRVQYDVVVKNLKTIDREINLTKSALTIEGKSYPIECHKNDSSLKAFPIKAGSLARIVCDSKIAISPGQIVRNGTLEISLADVPLQFNYFLPAGEVK